MSTINNNNNNNNVTVLEIFGAEQNLYTFFCAIIHWGWGPL